MLQSQPLKKNYWECQKCVTADVTKINILFMLDPVHPTPYTCSKVEVIHYAD